MFVMACASFAQEPLLKIGLFADCQFAQTDKEGSSRQYTRSATKLEQAIAWFNAEKVDFTVSLGDLVDANIESAEELAPILAKAHQPIRHVMGNHDLLPKERLRMEQILGLAEPYYYSLVENGVRIIVLNSTNVSQEQTKWIAEEFKTAQNAGEITIIMSHHPIYYPFGIGIMANSTQIREQIESDHTVHACFSGHVHLGGYTELNGVHYLTLKGMVESPNNRHAIINIYTDRIEVVGRGEEQDKLLKFIKK